MNGLDRLQTRRFCRAGKCAERSLVAIGGEDAGARSEPEREGADAAKQVGDLFRSHRGFADDRRQRTLPRLGRLQESTRRQHDARLPDLQRGFGELRHGFAMAREAGEPLLGSDPRQR